MGSPANVKAIMARFNTGPDPAEGVPAGASRAGSVEEVPGGRPRTPLHPTFSSGAPALGKKPGLEGRLSGSSITGAPKPSFLKSTAPEVCEFPRPLAPAVAKQPAFKPKPPEVPRESEPKPLYPKVAVQRPSLSGTAEGKTCPTPPPALTKPPLTQAKPPPALTKPPLTQAKPPPALTKPPLGLANPPTSPSKPSPSLSKPSWIKDDPKGEDAGGGGGGGPLNTPKAPLGPKPKSAVSALRNRVQEGGSTPPFPQKPSSFRAAQSRFNKESSDSQGPEKNNLTPLNSHDPPVPKPSVTQRGSFVRMHLEQKENSDPSAPKRKQLLNKLALGSPPAKPNRPPNVNLDKFRKQAEPLANGPGMKKGTPLPPHHGNHVDPPLLPPPVAPSLPPRPLTAMNLPEPDENYDDVGRIMDAPPPPPGGHPSQTVEDSGSDEEMYEDLDERWPTQESKEQEKKREKEEKKRIEQEKKEQREREKKEQDARKKFKLSGPIQVIHKLKAKVDCKGNKTDLSLKQGDFIEIVRISDNPEGRWLGRSREGSFGYVKTESVEIDFDALKRQGEILPASVQGDPEVYDDIGVQDDVIRVTGPGVILPPPPDEDGEIYDELDDLDLSVRVPPPPQFTPEGHTEEELIDEEIYDDVDAQPGPPTSSLSSLLQMQSKAKPEEKDPKKQKKFEKEEKDFRKKFKFEGEIQVLYQVTIISTLASKKWGNKDLALRPGETVDVIVKPKDNKLIGRNEEGKFGYVSTSHIVAEDPDIYDDIGEDCIYDND
ncbi:FYN-binding protein 1 isoform X2 [Conger conger]|uniref:FYN-binding protein 1 isoform X2 n=1 Tax=Conger conger TaxID=82655 RepID=UPI002A5A7A98|nr:FYN-binding protein 1 isoform X2 [Conger conger]